MSKIKATMIREAAERVEEAHDNHERFLALTAKPVLSVCVLAQDSDVSVVEQLKIDKDMEHSVLVHMESLYTAECANAEKELNKLCAAHAHPNCSLRYDAPPPPITVDTLSEERTITLNIAADVDADTTDTLAPDNTDKE